MCFKFNLLEKAIKQKPQIFLKNITFNDGSRIKLNRNSIIVFTGPNNSGKSQVLKDVENSLNSSCYDPKIVLKSIDTEFLGEINEKNFLSNHFVSLENQQYQQICSGISFSEESLLSKWKEQKLDDNILNLFVKRLCTEKRLTESEALNRNFYPERHSLYKLYRNQEIEQTISDYFHQAFGVDLILNRFAIQHIPLHVGIAPDKKAYTMEMQNAYYEEVAKLPKLENQGDGMRSFASILLDTFTSDYNITMVDEPEAFLHPPQARMLGKMLAKNNPTDRQLFISTHSEDFLQGLLDADNENVTVIRISRDKDLNKMSVLNNSEIKELWGNPILRYSNILSGLFHEKVVVCESDYDCLFYQAVMNAIFESKNEIAPDILFTHCGGKNRVKDVVKALKAVNVPVAAICDFDLLNNKTVFKQLAEAFGSKWNESLQTDMKIIYDNTNAKGVDFWKQIKKIGKFGFTGDSAVAYEKVEKNCKSFGLFVVPFGEMECFDKTINKEKKDWVYEVLEKYKLEEEPKLENARSFISEVVCL